MLTARQTDKVTRSPTHTVRIVLECWRRASVGPRCTQACGREKTVNQKTRVCSRLSLWLVTNVGTEVTCLVLKNFSFIKKSDETSLVFNWVCLAFFIKGYFYLQTKITALKTFASLLFCEIGCTWTQELALHPPCDLCATPGCPDRYVMLAYTSTDKPKLSWLFFFQFASFSVTVKVIYHSEQCAQYMKFLTC